MESGQAPQVLAVLVAHDGLQWLPETLDALQSQSYPKFDIIAVDNGSRDESRRLLIDRLGEQHVLVAERDIGFPGAVSMGVDAPVAAGAEYLLLVHDDSALQPGAMEALVGAMEADSRLGIVGCKLVDWEDPRRLQQVGMSIDATGRADSGVEADELDQGQRDAQQRALYVSSTGMLVRRSVFEELGRFDRRYHLLRDDLDLCWRAWLAGHDVEVIPSAVVRHAAAASNYRRLGQTATLGPRYFSERNTLATLLKCYGGLRLLVVLPLFFLVGAAKVLGFIATRRLSDSWQTVRAWLWNVRHLRRTWRLRRRVQRSRLRGDAELRHLFGRVGPRVRAYGEAVADWVAGGEPDFDRAPADISAEPATATARIRSYTKRRPVGVAAVVLALVGLAAALPLLGAGELRGGQLAPWPNAAADFFASYGSSWHSPAGIGTEAPPSPAQALLGIIDLLAFGSAWLAPRLLLFGALPAAWILALRAGRVITVKRVPRLAAATVYVLSPPALAALRTGRISALVTLAMLPAVVAAGHTVLSARRPSQAWRAAAGGALASSIAIAFEPIVLLPLAVAGVLAVVWALLGRPAAGDSRRTAGLLLAMAGGVPLLLFPWSLQLLRSDGPLFTAWNPGATAQPFWRWLLMAPETAGFPGPLIGASLVLAGVLGVVFGASRRTALVISLWAVVLVGVELAWLAGRAGEDSWAWPGLPMLLSSAGLAGLLAVALSSAGAHLSAHAFGWRQIGAVATTLAVLVGVGAAGWSLLTAPWDGFAVAQPPLPTFLDSESEAVGPFRVLVIDGSDGATSWDLTTPRGPTMASYGVREAGPLIEMVQGAVDDAVLGTDPTAAGRLGIANVRYVYIPPGAEDESLTDALRAQLNLEPYAVVEGTLYAVEGWLPRAAMVPPAAAQSVSRRAEVDPDVEPLALERVEVGRYEGTIEGHGALLLAESAANGWVASVNGTPLRAHQSLGLMRFDVTGQTGDVLVQHDRQATRSAAVALQLFFVLVAFSLMLRPPRFAEESLR